MYCPASRIVQTVLALAACIGFAATAPAALINLTPQGGASNSASSVALADLISNNDTIVVGDKEFSGFSYSRISDMPASADVRVLGFRDTEGNWGISFHGAFLDLPGGTASDALIRFAVQVAAPQVAQGIKITGSNLFIGGVGVGGDESIFLVDESFAENDALLEAFVTTIGAGPQQVQTSDSATFAGVTKLNVTKDILAIAAAGTALPSRATVIDQSFEQIPEPTSVVLLGLSTIGLVGANRRRRG